MALSRKDFDKLKRLRTTFDLNYRWTHLVSDLLTFAPAILTEEMVNALCADGDFSKHEAVCALLSEVLGLRPEQNADDRVLLHKYLSPAVRIFSPDRYAEDSYVKAVAGNEISLGRFEYKMKSYPPYRAAVAGDVETDADSLERMPLCFFDGPFSFFSVTEDGNDWMTLTPVDIDTCTEAIARAHGRVVTFGLGLGYFAFKAAEKAEVSEVTVVEKSHDIIEAFRTAILPRFPHGEKIRIVEADAFAYAEEVMPKERFDLCFADTWRDAGDGLPMYLKLKPLEKLCPETEYLYWIEDFLLSRLRSAVFEEIWEKESAVAHGTQGDTTFEDIQKQLSEEGLRRLAAEGTAEILRIFTEDI